MGSHEPVVDVRTPMPKGYGFLKKGNAYRTGLCRRLTHAEGKTLFVVTQKRTPIGLRAPKSILGKVFQEDHATRDSRRAAVERRDEATQDEFRDAILAQYPRIPADSAAAVLRHTLRKRSGRVGRTGTLALEAKARLAVAAHVRHCHTGYDEFFKREGVSRDEAREKVQDDVVRVLREWGGGKEPLQKQNVSKKGRKDGGQRQPEKAQAAMTKGTKTKGRTAATKDGGTKTGVTANTTNHSSMEHESNPRPGLRRSTRRSQGQGSGAQLEMLDHFSNGEDNPIMIDSSSEDSDAEGLTDGSDIDEADREDLDSDSAEFIVFDSDDDSDEEFELD